MSSIGDGLLHKSKSILTGTHNSLEFGDPQLTPVVMLLYTTHTQHQSVCYHNNAKSISIVTDIITIVLQKSVYSSFDPCPS